MIERKTIDLETVGVEEEDVEWELRPGGMLVQKREDGDNNGGIGGGGDSGSGSAMISIKVHHGSILSNTSSVFPFNLLLVLL